MGEGVRAALAAAAERLRFASDTPRLDAELLMAHALGVSRQDLLFRHLDAPAPPGFPALLARRLAHERGRVLGLPRGTHHERLPVRSERGLERQQPGPGARGQHLLALAHLHEPVAREALREDIGELERLAPHRLHRIAPQLRDVHHGQ